MDNMNTKTLGCTLLIAGTTIGAGMLALPLASSSLGGPATLASGTCTSWRITCSAPGARASPPSAS